MPSQSDSAQWLAENGRVSLRRVLDLSHGAIGTDQPDCAPLFASLQKGPPELLNLRPEARLYKVVKFAADEFVPWKPEQPARTATGVLISAIVVCDEDGFSRLVDNRPEKQFKLFQAGV